MSWAWCCGAPLQVTPLGGAGGGAGPGWAADARSCTSMPGAPEDQTPLMPEVTQAWYTFCATPPAIRSQTHAAPAPLCCQLEQPVAASQAPLHASGDAAPAAAQVRTVPVVATRAVSG